MEERLPHAQELLGLAARAVLDRATLGDSTARQRAYWAKQAYSAVRHCNSALARRAEAKWPSWGR